ncbi:MAG: transposase [Candidatus Jettenia sp.]|nr:MAG: transposase [Candidatus Jettenia sp.]
MRLFVYQHLIDELKKRLHLTAQKKKKKLLMYLKYPAVSPENNCTERALRHAVVICKISHSARSEDS